MVQRRGTWIPGKERAEKVLAGAITIDGRKKWICKSCSESNVWTRWRCRRCYNNIPAGLRGKCRQAVAARTGEVVPSSRRTRSTRVRRLRSKSFGRRLSDFEDKQERQDRMDQVTRSERKALLRKTGEWKWRTRSRAERSWTSRATEATAGGRKIHHAPQEIQCSLKENLQQQLQDVVQRRNDLLPEHQRAEEVSEDAVSRTKEEEMQRETPAALEEMRKIREDLTQRGALSSAVGQGRQESNGRSGNGSGTSRGLQAGEERRGSNASQTVDCCLDTVNGDQIEVLRQRISWRKWTSQVQMPGKEGRQNNKGQEQGKTSQQLVLPTPGIMKALQQALLSMTSFGFGVYMVNAEEQGILVQQMRACELDVWSLEEGVLLARERIERQPGWGPEHF